MSNEGEGWEQVYISAEAAPGSEFVGWKVENTEFEACGTLTFCAPFFEPPETGSGEAKVIATFDLASPKFKLTVKAEGTGTVTSSPAGIECPPTCSAKFKEGTEVTLVATPTKGSSFTGWSGCESILAEPKGACLVTMSAAKEVTAKFKEGVKPSFAFKVELAGTGTGKVTSSPAGIECPPTCSAEFEESTEVTLSASASAGSEFSGWSGSGCSGTGTCKVTMSEAKEVVATFDLKATKGSEPVKVILAGSGAGKAFIAPEATKYRGSPEIKCEYKSPGPQTGACETFMSNEGEGYEQVLISAEAAPGSKFVGWKVENTEFEACGTLTFCAPFFEPPETGSGEAKVIATFDAQEIIESPSLRVLKTGEGAVISNPAGIACTGAKTGAECEANFEVGKMVTLTASPATDYAFSAWSGCTEHVGLTCLVLMDKAKTIKVTFVKTPLLTVEKAGSGYGKVTAMGISCDESCSKATSAIKTGTSVTVKTTPAKGSELAVLEGGTGSASGCSGVSCTFTISEKSSLKVKFDPKPTKSLTVNLTGPGAYKGKVTGKGIAKGLYGSTINCGAGCTTQTESFFAIDTVTLTAAAASGYTFAGWSGSGCSGTGTCTVATSSDKTVEAEFE
jgi:hypothetical protein